MVGWALSTISASVPGTTAKIYFGTFESVTISSKYEGQWHAIGLNRVKVPKSKCGIDITRLGRRLTSAAVNKKTFVGNNDGFASVSSTFLLGSNFFFFSAQGLI